MKKLAVCAAIALALGAAACSEQSDPEIIADANKAIADEDVPGSIRVASNNGVVTLTGIVPSIAAKNRAQEVVSDVDGVDRVVNNLRTAAGDAPAPGANAPRQGNLGAPGAPGNRAPMAPGNDMNRDRDLDANEPMLDGEPAPR